jgi:Repeat of Unknown Function (DUF347)
MRQQQPRLRFCERLVSPAVVATVRITSWSARQGLTGSQRSFSGVAIRSGPVTETTPPDAVPTSRVLLSKVPEVTVWFWVIKILCTTVGESFADWINMTLGSV